MEKYRLIAVSRRGLFGEWCSGSLEYCQECLREFAGYKENHPDMNIHVECPGLGFGVPFPVGAVDEMVLLAPGEDLTEEHWNRHIEPATKFCETVFGST